ncbi:Major facilitator superfamily domain, general substrate transporter [Lecanosticta acicola]|uniref:Major facilitator superfamily domain, general substrate transporter n=1 Tax=Lecanosticta acicola TaxID=111012 RepID=A0AAI8YYW5_9PEZI|nr:Major facilitator superfamily domain, general substrate transporter [Lecanosticta acicola]
MAGHPDTPAPTPTPTLDPKKERKTVDVRASQVEKQPSKESLKPPLGWRLNVIVIASFIAFFLSLLDTTIVAIALPAISDHFQEFDRSTWIINAYLITYMAFAILVSRLSDIFGRKIIQLASLVIFIGFSVGCALSQSITQLIIFRAFQGMGGCGMYSMCMVVCMTMLPPQRRSIMAAYVGVCMVCSGVLGPVLGGAITFNRERSTWPWIFWINLPVGCLTLGALTVAWPSDRSRTKLTWAALASVDFFGSLLLLAASALMVFALQAAGSYQYAWSSATIVACLVVSGVCFLVFAAWQHLLTKRPRWSIKVVFPIHLVIKRVIAAATVTTLLLGFTYYLAVVNIPERLQIVSGSSPIIAGLQMLPFLVFSAIGSVAGGVASRKDRYTAQTLVVAQAIALLGYGLLTTLGNAREVPAKLYGFQIFIGLGNGASIVCLTRLMETAVEPKWIAVTQGALAQMRTLGGSIGLAIAVIVFNAGVRASSAINEVLSPAQLNSLFRSPLAIATFTPPQQQLVAEAFAHAFTQQMRIATYIAAAGFIASLFALPRLA